MEETIKVIFRRSIVCCFCVPLQPRVCDMKPSAGSVQSIKIDIDLIHSSHISYFQKGNTVSGSLVLEIIKQHLVQMSCWFP